ncbi:MAG: LysR family transcriptional regulator [Clostridium sp.]
MEQNLSQYRIFYAVAKTGNISKTAKELFISQPAISKSISKLEENLGVSLFTRNSRGVQLTAEGQVLYSHVSHAFDTLNRGENELKRIKDFNIGQIKVGVSNTLCKYILLPYLKNFVEQYPHIKVTIDSQDTARTINMLEQQQLDIGLIAEPKIRRSLTFLPVMQIADTFVCTKAYLENLKVREGSDVDVFSAGTIMLLDRNNMTRTHIDTYFADNNIEPKQVLEANTMDLLIEFAKIGLGIGCVIREFVKKELADGSLIEIHLHTPIRNRTVGFAYNTAYITKAMSLFIKFCTSDQTS